MVRSDGFKNMNVLIVGGGEVSREYAKICSSLSVNAQVVSRTKTIFESLTHIEHVARDFFSFTSQQLNSFSHIIIAVQPRFTFSLLSRVLTDSKAKILVEKPVCLSSLEFNRIGCEEFDERVFVAFNRRFFISTIEAKKILAGKTTLNTNVCFTEMKDRMRGSKEELNVWGMCNTIHLFDMAFYLVGTPENIQTSRSTFGEVDSYRVMGTLPNGIMSMNAHWGGPGNWGITITTPDEKLYFDPLETLRIQNNGSFSKNQLTLEKRPDDVFKDGFLSQTIGFLNGSRSEFIRYQEYKDLILIIEKIFN